MPPARQARCPTEPSRSAGRQASSRFKEKYNQHETAAYLRAVIAAGSYGAYIDRTYNDLYVLRLLVHQGRATIRDAGTPENPLDDKLVYAMKCFVGMEDGTEQTLLKNIFQWWCSDPMEMAVYEPTEDDLRREDT